MTNLHEELMRVLNYELDICSSAFGDEDGDKCHKHLAQLGSIATALEPTMHKAEARAWRNGWQWAWAGNGLEGCPYKTEEEGSGDD